MAYNWKRQASEAYGYSLVRLALQLFMYIDGLPQSCEGAAGQEFMELLGQYLDGTLAEGPLGDYRDSLTGQMETVVAFADCFRIYEYAWNRLERRFEPDRKPTGWSDEDMTRALMGYLTSDKDAAVVNQRIQQIIGQLPVRFTRRKYYGMVRDALTSYIGADLEGLNNEMYLLRTSAMVELTEEQKGQEPELCDLLHGLEAISMRDADKAMYRQAQADIQLASDRLSVMADELQQLQDLVNDLYVLLLTREDALGDAALEAQVDGLLRGLYQVYREWQAGGSGVIPEELSDGLTLLEGRQEEFFEAYSRLDSVPARCEGEVEIWQKGRKVERLLSSSPYVSLCGETVQGTVTAEAVETEADGFIASLEPVFASCQKPVMRAIMAQTLACLPVCFNSLDEIQRYIEGSLGSCSDFAEKETCKELLLQLMEMDDYDAMV